ncbi:MAG TPA: DUF167 domain-containing protein [Steroidobacteraceae bacterium]|nr:DUF167 domain-containing protein [Steroidobacteraceae bacterium]
MAARIIQIKVTVRARESSLTQLPDGTWVAKLKSPPVDGKANAELIALVAKQFGCSKAAVSIKSGASGRLKLVRIEAASDTHA